MKDILRFIIIAGTILTLISPCMAQKTIYAGQIKDQKTSEPVPGVSVSVSDSLGTVSDVNGNFRLISIKRYQNIRFSMVGFETQNQGLNFSDDSVWIDVLLNPQSVALGPSVVSASRFEQSIETTPLSMEIIRPYLLKNTAATNFENSLDQVPGVTVTDGSVSIRGGSGFSYGAGSRVLLLIDDLPFLTADAGDIKWTALPIETLGQVEVIKGASSAAYGSGALNGVVHLRTMTPPDTPQFSVSILHGFFDKPKESYRVWWGKNNPNFSGATATYARKLKNFNLISSLNFFRDEGYRKGEDEKRGRAHFRVQYFFPKIKGLSVFLAGNGLYGEGGNFLMWADDSAGAFLPLGGLDTPSTTISDYKNYRISVDPGIAFTGNKGFSHKLRGRFFRSNNSNNTNQGSVADMFFGEYAGVLNKEKGFNLSWGLGYNGGLVNSDLYGNHNSKNAFGFLQGEQTFFKRLKFSLGGRAEYFSLDSTVYSGDFLLLKGLLRDSVFLLKNSSIRPMLRSGLNLRILKATFLRASYGEGLRYPTIAEKFIRTRAGAIFIFPNDSVMPETGWTTEAGIRQVFKVGDWVGYADFAFFQTEYNEMMEFSFGVWDTNPPPGTLGIGFKSRNVTRAGITGWEASCGGQGKILGFDINLMAGLTKIDPVQLNFNPGRDTIYGTSLNNVLKYRSRWVGRGDVEIGRNGNFVGASIRYSSWMENIDRAFAEFIPGVKNYRATHTEPDWVLDARLGFIIMKGLSVTVNARNLLNHVYMGRPADMQPPRSFVFSVKVDF